MGLHDRDLPQRILHAARRLQLCGRTQAAARLANLVAAGFHPRLFPQIIDPGRTHTRRTRPGHVHFPAAATHADARDEDESGSSLVVGEIEACLDAVNLDLEGGHSPLLSEDVSIHRVKLHAGFDLPGLEVLRCRSLFLRCWIVSGAESQESHFRFARP